MSYMEEVLKNNYEAIKYFRDIKPRTYQLLGYLGYNKETEIEAPYGKWDIYTKRNFSFPYFNTPVGLPVNRFVALYKGTENKSMLVYGSFEKEIDEIKNVLMVLSETVLAPVKKFLGIPTTLTEENAQDYGYIRGVIFGITLILADFVYSWTFALREGILTSFIEYIKKVHEGNPSITNVIGIMWTGMYFGIPLILVPIIYGNICMGIARRRRVKMVQKIEEISGGYEFGINAEKALEEEFATIIEEKRKQVIFEEIRKTAKNLDKDGFETLYTNIRAGFISPEALNEFIKEFKELTGGEISLEEFVEIVAKYQKAGPSTEIGIKV